MTAAKNSRILRTIPLLITICLFSFPAYAKYGGGSGTAQDPYQIATAEDLMLLGDSPDDYGRHFVLTADIDLDPNLPGRKVFDKAVIAPTPSWQGGTPFTGVFDGNGHTISNLAITGKDYLGLFGQLGYWLLGGEVKNLGVVGGSITGSGYAVGGLVGSNGSWDGTVGTVTQCYSTGAVSGTEQSVGGLVGENYGDVTQCYSSGVVSGNSYVGGLVGSNGGSITTSYSTGAVSGTQSVGGLVGANGGSGAVADCYSDAAVRGTYNVGGLVGDNGDQGTVTQCYSTGAVSSTGYVGGLMANPWGTEAQCSQCFWDTQTSSQTKSAGGTGRTTAEMQTASTFLDAGWDFVDETVNGTEDIWWILEGQDYPRLWWETSPGPSRQLEFEEVFSYDLGEFWCGNHLAAVADFDQDGLADIVLLVTTTYETEPPWHHVSKAILLHNEGNWQFSESTIIEYPEDHYGCWVQAADLNNDQCPDLVIRESAGTHVLLNNRSGRLDEVWTGGPGYDSLDLADVDGDTFADILSGTQTVTGGMIEVFRNNGLGTSFQKTWESGKYGQFFSGTINNIFAANLNGDGSPDIAATEIYAGLLLTFLGDGTGSSFTQKTRLNLGDRTFSLAVGNVNGDNLTDLAVYVGWGRVHVFLSQGDGSLVEHWVGPDLHNAAFNLALADFDLDGYDDVFVGTYADGALRIYGNRPGAGFELIWDHDLAGKGHTGTVADLDGDGHLDLLVGEEGTIRILHSRSVGGTGGTTTQMQTAGTFLNAGWDFIDETANGTEDIWWILEGQDYPRLWWELIDDNAVVTPEN